MSAAAQALDLAIKQAGDALRLADNERVKKTIANACTLLNWALHLQQRFDSGEPFNTQEFKQRRD